MTDLFDKVFPTLLNYRNIEEIRVLINLKNKYI